MGKTYLPPEKRPDKTPQHLKADITFDLINAFGLVKNPTEAALLLQDILTEKEFVNLGKRLRIAKELLSGAKQEQIIEDYHCGFSLVSKVQRWLVDGGVGLRKVISRLPKRKTPPKFRVHTLPARLRTPQTLWDYIQYLRANGEDKEIKKFIDKMGYKAVMDKANQESFDQFYREKAFQSQIANKTTKSK